MSRPPPESPPRPPRRLHLALAVGLSAIPLLVLGGIELPDYDAFWHVFIARQDHWRNLVAEIRGTAHPPVFFLALRAVVGVLGASPFVYRLVSIAATIGSSWLVGRIVQRATGRPWLPAVAAFTFGSSLSAVSIGLEVRAYALSTLFMLWACAALLALAERAFSAPEHRSRVVFAVMTSLALLTHYGTAFFLLGGVAAVAAAAATDRAYRRRLLAAGRRHWRANLLALATPAAVLAITYAVHIESWAARPITHLFPFLFDPRREGVFEFVGRSTRALCGLFLPALRYQPFLSTREVVATAPPNAAATILVVAALAAIAWLGFRRPADDDGDAIARRILALLLAAMTALVVVAALLGRYPYGGLLRHQFVLFPFAVIFLVLVLDAVAAKFNRRIAGLGVGLFALAALLNAAHWLAHYRLPGGDPHRIRMDRFDQLFPAPEAIYVDQYNLVHLFRHHHDGQWRFARRLRGYGAVDLWRVRQAGAREFFVCRDRRQWLLDLASQATYRRLRQCLDATGARRVTVLRFQQRGRSASWPAAQTAEIARRGAAPAGLTLEKRVVWRDNFYAEFARR